MSVMQMRRYSVFSQTIPAAIAAWGIGAVAGCASSAENVQQISLAPDPEVQEEFYRAYLDYTLKNFGEFELGFRDDPNDLSDHLRVIIEPAFEEPLLIALRIDVWAPDEFEDGQPDVYLYAKTFVGRDSGPEDIDPEIISFSGYSVDREIGKISWSKITRESFAVRLPVEEGNRVIAGFKTSQGPKLPFTKPTERLCVDGDFYFVDMRLDLKKSAYARHVCDPDFVKDFSVVEPLLEIAASELPGLSEIISNYGARIIETSER